MLHRSAWSVFVNIRSVITIGIVRHCCLYNFLLCLVHCIIAVAFHNVDNETHANDLFHLIHDCDPDALVVAYNSSTSSVICKHFVFLTLPVYLIFLCF